MLPSGSLSKHHKKTFLPTGQANVIRSISDTTCNSSAQTFLLSIRTKAFPFQPWFHEHLRHPLQPNGAFPPPYRLPEHEPGQGADGAKD